MPCANVLARKGRIFCTNQFAAALFLCGHLEHSIRHPETVTHLDVFRCIDHHRQLAVVTQQGTFTLYRYKSFGSAVVRTSHHGAHRSFYITQFIISVAPALQGTLLERSGHGTGVTVGLHQLARHNFQFVHPFVGLLWQPDNMTQVTITSYWVRSNIAQHLITRGRTGGSNYCGGDSCSRESFFHCGFLVPKNNTLLSLSRLRLTTGELACTGLSAKSASWLNQAHGRTSPGGNPAKNKLFCRHVRAYRSLRHCCMSWTRLRSSSA